MCTLIAFEHYENVLWEKFKGYIRAYQINKYAQHYISQLMNHTE